MKKLRIMKRLKVTICSYLLLASLCISAQPQIAWRFANPALVHIEDVDRLEFDVQLKASSGGTYMFSGQINLTFNNDAFLTSNLHTIAIRSGISNDYSVALSNYKYNITRNNTGIYPQKVINVALTPGDVSILQQSPGSSLLTQLDGTWQTFIRLRITLNNNALKAGIAFIKASMNGQISYHSAAGQITNYASPNQFETIDLSQLYLGRIYAAASGWSQSGEEGLNWSSSTNTSIFDGNANLTATDLTTARAENLNFIGSAVLTIPENKWLTVDNELLSDSPQKLIIQDGGSMIHHAGNAKASQQRSLSGGSINASTHRYHLIGIPMHESEVFTAGQLFMGLHLWELDAASQNWSKITQASHPINNREGYLLWHSQNNHLLEIPGLLNSSDIIIDAEPLGINTDGRSYRLIPNPYASALQWIQPPGYDAAIYFFDAETGNYVSFADGVPGPSIAPSGQSFFVKTSLAGGVAPSINISRNNRLHHERNFYKQNDNIPELLTIRATTSISHDDVHVRFHPDAANAYDADRDALKLFGFGDAPQLYTTTDGVDYAINCLQTTQAHIAVPMSFRMNTSGDVTLNASGIQSFSEGAAIFLEDTYLNTMTNLKTQGQYQFEHNPNQQPERFILHLYGVLGAGEHPPAQCKIWAYNHNVYVSISGSSNDQVSVELFDLRGSLLGSSRHATDNPIVIFGGRINQVIVVKVRSGGLVCNKKVFIY